MNLNLLPHLEFIYKAHGADFSEKSKRVRYWDQQTPYAIHPIWCATTLLTETSLPEEIRTNGALALLYHDVLEDTSAKLPADLPTQVETLVADMTFDGGFEEEQKKLLKKDDLVLLLKLYDKTSNLLDGVWMSPKLYSQYHSFTQKIANRVEKKYGQLNIVKIFNSLDEEQQHG